MSTDQTLPADLTDPITNHPRYRDRHNRLWEDRDGPLLIGPGGPQCTDYVTMQAIHHAYGPLTPVDNDGRQEDDEGTYPDADRGFEIRVSPDQRNVAIYDPGNAPWLVPADQGRFVRTHELDQEGWVQYVPAGTSDALTEARAENERLRAVLEAVSCAATLDEVADALDAR